jgi:succinate dehydrogenase / fumarate reductase cytochrome b subunit
MDTGLYTLADRLGVTLYDVAAVAKERAALEAMPSGGGATQSGNEYNAKQAVLLGSLQKYQAHVRFVKALEKQKVAAGHVIACAKEFGTASLLTVRDTFKSPIYIGLYTIFVIAACFHACKGFWTFLITWGWVLKMAAQRAWVMVSIALMALLLFLGLIAVWGTYWMNLRM